MAPLSPSFGLSPVASPIRSLGLHQFKTEAMNGGPGRTTSFSTTTLFHKQGNWPGEWVQLVKVTIPMVVFFPS